MDSLQGSAFREPSWTLVEHDTYGLQRKEKVKPCSPSHLHTAGQYKISVCVCVKESWTVLFERVSGRCGRNWCWKLLLEWHSHQILRSSSQQLKKQPMTVTFLDVVHLRWRRKTVTGLKLKNISTCRLHNISEERLNMCRKSIMALLWSFSRSKCVLWLIFWGGVESALGEILVAPTWLAKDANFSLFHHRTHETVLSALTDTKYNLLIYFKAFTIYFVISAYFHPLFSACCHPATSLFCSLFVSPFLLLTHTLLCRP